MRSAIISELLEALKEHYESSDIGSILSRGEEAILSNLDEDDLIEALAGFLHLSENSDDFGCDILGYLQVNENERPKPVFLEVKGDQDRRFQVSTNEWEQAIEIGDSYAFLIVLREKADSKSIPFELLPNPVKLEENNLLVRDNDGWIIKYK